MSKKLALNKKLLSAYDTYKKNEFPPISPRANKRQPETNDKTGIFTILRETKKEIIDQINELYNEGDPELFFQYAKKVAKFNRYNPTYFNKLNVFDRDLPIQKSEKKAKSKTHRTETSMSSSIKTETANSPKFTRTDLKKLKQKFNEDK